MSRLSRQHHGVDGLDEVHRLAALHIGHGLPIQGSEAVVPIIAGEGQAQTGNVLPVQLRREADLLPAGGRPVRKVRGPEGVDGVLQVRPVELLPLIVPLPVLVLALGERMGQGV